VGGGKNAPRCGVLSSALGVSKDKAIRGGERLQLRLKSGIRGFSISPAASGGEVVQQQSGEPSLTLTPNAGPHENSEKKNVSSTK